MVDVADEFSFSLWLGKSTWSAEQALLLLSGLDPDLDDPDPGLDIAASLLRHNVDKWRRLIDAARTTGQLPSDDCLTPPTWLDWATSQGCSVPEELLKVASHKSNKIDLCSGKFRDRKIDNPLHAKERKSLLKIILGLAHRTNIDFDSISKEADSISETLRGLGLHISRRTIEEHLKTAREMLFSKPTA